MKRFWKGKKGAVTIMVTLLLIPALLVSGTGVDLARIYTARSIVQDANQMAANSVLTQYDAMLQDIYGLFALSSQDVDLNTMVTDYVNLSLYGTKTPQVSAAGMGTFRLFSGSVASCQVSPQQVLGQTTALRHQIEEYAKFRAPVTIADEIIDRLKSFEKVKANADVIKDKVAIDNMVSDMQVLCLEVKTAIDEADKIRKEQTDLIAELNKLLTEVNRQFNQMLSYRNAYESIRNSGDLYEKEKLEEYERAYATFQDNMSKIATANGTVSIKKWIEGDINADGEWEFGSAKKEKSLARSISSLIDDVKSQKMKDKWGRLMDSMVTKCEQLDSRCESIKKECDNLQAKLDSGECDEDLAKEISKQIKAYQELVLSKAKPLAEEVRTYNTERLDLFVDNFSGVVYGNLNQDNRPTEGSYVSISTLTALDSIQDYAINVVEINQTLQGSQKADTTKLSKMANLKGYKYSDRYRYAKFGDGSVFRNGQQPFYEALEKLAQESDETKAKGIIDNILDFLKTVQEKLKGLYDYDPQGARYYKAPAKTEESNQFGQGEAWNDKDGVMAEMNGALDQVNGLVGALDQASRKLLLVAYASEMFSCYTDEETVNNAGAKRRTTLSGIPMDTNVNYFYQSELEYLYGGNLGSSAANLLAVSGTILLIRFVFNYIATFSVQSVTTVIESIKTALSAIPLVGTVVGIAVGELARIAFALGESVVDVTDLRNGDPVPLTKNETTWRLSLVNFVESAAADKFAKESNLDGDDYKSGLYYIDYLRIFLLMKGADTLTVRMEDLIELNVTNAKNGIYQKGTKISGNEGAMSGASYFELDNQAISVQVSTEVELRFLFFSMGYFQKGINGVRPPETLTISTVDYRGY